MKRQPVLLIVGDSITLGAAETTSSQVVRHVSTSYVAHLERLLPGVRVAVEAGVHRTTTEGLAALPAMLDRHAPDVVFSMLGGNDAEPDWKRFVLSEGRVIRHKVAVERYVANLEGIIALTRAAGAVPVLTNFPCANARVRADHISRLSGRDVWAFVQNGGGQAEWDRRYRTYVTTAEGVASRTGAVLVPYADVLDESAAGEPLFCEDGAHPNDAGHARIATAFAPKLSELLARIVKSDRRTAATLLEGVP